MPSPPKPKRPVSRERMAFLEGFFKGPADRHGFTHRFHRGGEDIVGFGEFFKGPAGNFDHAVIDGWLKGRQGLAGNIVVQFVEGIADGQFGGNLGDRKAGGFGGQRRTPRHPRVHLDDHHLAVCRIDGELDVRAAGLHADLPDDGDRRIAHLLVFPIGQGLDRGDGDAVAGVDAHGVDIFDGADDDHVVVVVAHHLQLIFLPAEQAALQHDLGGHRQVEPGGAEIFQFLAIVGDPAAGAAEGETRPDDQRKTESDRRRPWRSRESLTMIDSGTLRPIGAWRHGILPDLRLF